MEDDVEVKVVDLADVESLTWRFNENDAKPIFAVVTGPDLVITKIGTGGYNYQDYIGRKLDDLCRAMHPFYPLRNPWADISLLRVTTKEQNAI